MGAVAAGPVHIWRTSPLPAFGAADLAAAHRVIEQYADQSIGVADASIVVLADRLGSRTIATLDRRHFEVLRPLTRG